MKYSGRFPVRYITRIGIAFLIVTGTPVLAEQGDDSPFLQHRSQHSYNSVYGLPAVAPRLVQSVEWQVSVEHSNQFAGGQEGDEILLLDGETTRLAIQHRQRLAACWQFEATVPFVSHSGGKFDRSIDNWHKFFGLPDADRDTSAFDNLNFQYAVGGSTRHDVSRAQSGIGDVQLGVQFALGCSATADSTPAEPMIRAGIKLPTGNAAELRGSGEADLYVDWQSPMWRYYGRWQVGAAVGLLLNGRTERFAEQEGLVMYGSAGTQFAFYHRLRLVAQLDAHTPFYKSELRELGDTAINLILGLRYLAGRAYSVELSFSEDAAIDTTPDIVGRIAISYRPDQMR